MLTPPPNGPRSLRDDWAGLHVEDIFAATDWKLLSQQKQLLLSLADTDPGLDGLINWIDHLQEAAKHDGFPVVWLGAQD